MDEESNIKPAEVKEGLETGGLETGSLSAKDRVAASYEPDLSGRNGARARFDAIEELIGKQLEEFSSNMTFSSGGGTKIFGSNGHFVVSAAPTRAGGVVASQAFDSSTKLRGPWDLIVNNSSNGSVSINPGTILADASDLEVGLSIININAAFNVGAGQRLVLKTTNISSPTVVLELVGDWTDYPARYEVEDDEENATFEAYFYPLWAFTGSDGPGAVVCKVDNDGNPTVFGYRAAEASNLELIYTFYYKTPDRPLLVPRFISSHRVIP